MEKIACYIRVSTEEQKLHGISLDAQRDKLTEYAAKHGLHIVAWYEDEGVSGRKLIRKRPQLQRMLNDAQRGLFDRIIFIKLDRFFRSVAEYHECMKKIEPVTWTATEEKYDLTTANGRAFVNMKLTIAELEADQTGERISIVNDYKIKSGQAVTGSQSQGIAFKVEKIDNVKRVVPDEEYKALVMDFINHFLTYNNKRQAVLYVNEKYGKDLSYNSLTKLLKDTKLYGSLRGNDNYCEPYIDKATFDKIQEQLKKNIKANTEKNTYLFSGLILCPVCATNLSGTSSGKRNYKRDYGKRLYHYDDVIKAYRCNKRITSRTCSFNHNVGEKRIEKYLIDNLDKLVNQLISEVYIEDASVKDTANTDKIKQLKAELSRLNNMYLKNRISETDYDKRYIQLDTDIKALESRIQPPKERDLTVYQDLVNSDWKSLYERLNEENKRAFWRQIIERIIIDAEGNITGVLFL